MYFYIQTRSGIIRINVSHTTVTESSFSTLQLKSIIIRPFEFVFNFMQYIL